MIAVQLKYTKKVDITAPLLSYLEARYSKVRSLLLEYWSCVQSREYKPNQTVLLRRSSLALPLHQNEVARHADAVRTLQSLRDAVASVQTPNAGALEAMTAYLRALDSAAERFPVSETNIKVREALALLLCDHELK